MKLLELNDSNIQQIINDMLSVLKKGGIIIYPTETLYGLGANALDVKAINKIFQIKKRPKTKPLPIAVRNLRWAEELAFIDGKVKKILKAVWPGPITVVLPKKEIVPFVLTANSPNIAMRVSSSEFVNELLDSFGYPLISTSANISGQQPTNKISDIIGKFKKAKLKPDIIISKGDLPVSEPSTVLDLTLNKPKILRVGPTKPDVLMKLLET